MIIIQFFFFLHFDFTIRLLKFKNRSYLYIYGNIQKNFILYKIMKVNLPCQEQID